MILTKQNKAKRKQAVSQTSLKYVRHKYFAFIAPPTEGKKSIAQTRNLSLIASPKYTLLILNTSEKPHKNL